MFQLSKAVVRQVYIDLNLLKGLMLEIIEKLGYVLLNSKSVIDDSCLLSIDKEDDSNNSDCY